MHPKPTVLLILMSALFFSQPALAYVDPGSGSVIVTAILGFFAAIGYTLRKQFYRIKRLFSKDNSDATDQQE